MGVLKQLIGAGAMLAILATPIVAQDRAQTLGDIRQELTVLFVEIQRLKGELNTTGGASAPSGGGTTLDRVNAIEAELTRLTSKTEQLEFRIDSVVSDGTNAVGDLEFRLCELEPDCDIASLGDTPTLGGGELPTSGGGAAVTPDTTPTPDTGSQLAVAEQADYDRAVAALEAGSGAEAADLFARFTDAYPGSPLTGAAHYMRGEALSEQGLVAEAARAYLASYSGAPQGDNAPDALFKLGVALGELGQVTEACVTLGEVANRFPAAAAVVEAQAAQQSLGCN